MIGTTIQINDKAYKIIKIISEGGYGFVYLVEDDNSTRFALKKAITQDKERFNVITKELKFLKEYAKGPNPYFISYYDSKVIQTSRNDYTFYILLEYCSGGTLFDIMAKRLENGLNFTEPEILGFACSISNALKHIHSQGYVYCDMKVENCLFFDMDTIKLCDFGSINTFDLDFATLPKSMHYKYEEIFEKETTLMYRPPEMCDPYLKYKVNQKADMWMLGCVIYTLMFFKHPFFEASKLAITTASFNWPNDPVYSDKLEILVRNLLTPNPDLRPCSSTVVELLENWQNISIELNSMACDIKRSKEEKSNAIKHIGNGLPKGKVKKTNDLDFDVFDFSGLNKISKKSNTPVNIRPKAYSRPYGNKLTPNTTRSNNVFKDDIFTKVKLNTEKFDFFSKEENDKDLKLEFGQQELCDFGNFGESNKNETLKQEFEDFLSLNVESDKPGPNKKAVNRNDLDDIDFCNY